VSGGGTPRCSITAIRCGLASAAWIGRDHWGNGYATAALRAFLDVEHRRPLHAHVADHNVGSRRVLEKCGFVLDHSAQGEDVLEHVLVLTD
jgi:RimJ/RimL family protein N-acetyltransferase